MLNQEMMFAANIDEQRIKEAKTSNVVVTKFDPPLEFSTEELKAMGFSLTPSKRTKYKPNKKSRSSCKPITIRNQKFPSLAAASEACGIPYHQILKFSTGKITEKELLLRNAKRLMREEANRAYRESEENNN